MHAYLAIQYHEDHGNRERIEGISAMCEQCGMTTCCIARDVEQWGAFACEPSARMERSFQEIDASDIVLVDLTEKGVGIGIEAGYAFAKHTPIITIAQADSSISTTLKGISQHIFVYSQYVDMAEFLATIKREHTA